MLTASDRTLVSFFIGVAANGLYAIAYKFSGLVATFYGFFNMAWVETVSLHFDENDKEEYLSETIQLALGLFASVCLGIIAIMPFAFPIMINSKFNEAYYQIPILLIAVVFQILVGLLSAIYLAEKKSMVIAKTTILGAVINFLVDIVFISKIGLYAASLSTLISYASVAIYRAYDIRKIVTLKWNKRFVVSLIIMFLFVLIAYYSKIIIFEVIALVLTILYAFTINKDFLVKIWKSSLKIRKK